MYRRPVDRWGSTILDKTVETSFPTGLTYSSFLNMFASPPTPPPIQCCVDVNVYTQEVWLSSDINIGLGGEGGTSVLMRKLMKAKLHKLTYRKEQGISTSFCPRLSEYLKAAHMHINIKRNNMQYC